MFPSTSEQWLISRMRRRIVSGFWLSKWITRLLGSRAVYVPFDGSSRGRQVGPPRKVHCRGLVSRRKVDVLHGRDYNRASPVPPAFPARLLGAAYIWPNRSARSRGSSGRRLGYHVTGHATEHYLDS
jgi:hypothetical protein